MVKYLTITLLSFKIVLNDENGFYFDKNQKFFVENIQKYGDFSDFRYRLDYKYEINKKI